MTPWPKRPVIYEINAWAWLHELAERYGHPMTLGEVPSGEWDSIASLGIDAVWLMGVWERSPVSLRVSLAEPHLLAEYRRALPDFSSEDVVGSPYAVHRYIVDQRLGGAEGLATARSKLAERDVRLVLDFVPNHVAQDHPWVYDHPEYFIRGDEDDRRRAPPEFFEAKGNIIACGRDPYFPPWADTAQLNAFHPGLRRAAIETLKEIAGRCDGIRCDMAMLLLNSVFERTWGHRAGPRPATEFWDEVIGAIRLTSPNLLLIAEAYWDLEWELQQQGFDYTYDKRLYDRLVHERAGAIRLHLLADLTYQERLVRFIENHDEPRAAATFPPLKHRAAVVALMTLPGAKLIHEGQFEGRRVKLPVQLRRRPREAIDHELQTFYHRLLRITGEALFRQGEWHLCEIRGWPDNLSFENLVSWCWRTEESRSLIVINLSEQRSQGRVRLPWQSLRGRSWKLLDRVSGATYEREGDEMEDPGLYVDLKPWGFHFFVIEERPHSLSRFN